MLKCQAEENKNNKIVCNHYLGHHQFVIDEINQTRHHLQKLLEVLQEIGQLIQVMSGQNCRIAEKKINVNLANFFQDIRA